MRKTLITAIILLPGTVLVFVPALIVWLTRDTAFAARMAAPPHVAFWTGLFAAVPGLALMVWTARLFLRHGEGTPAPWAPPRRLVVRGPYRHVRNPMLSGVFLVLAAECLFLLSWPLVLWLLFVIAANMTYMPLVEEPGLEKRHGDAYRQYRANVPRWIPRIRPWSGAHGD